MWIFTNRGFISMVEDREKVTHLLIRARLQGHIESLFPGADVSLTQNADYRYRASIPKADAAQVMAALVTAIDYDNFKNTVEEPRYHRACFGVWNLMYEIQKSEPISIDRGHG
jgi:hypothetical protein